MGVLVRFRVLFLWKLIIFWDRGNRNAVIMREMAPGANGFFNISLLYFFAHPGAISPMGAISLIPVR